MRYLKARALADSAITFDFVASIWIEASALVHAAQLCLSKGMADGRLSGATEVMQAFCSVTLHYDCLATSQANLIAQVEALLAAVNVAAQPAGRLWQLPCCYAGDFAPDMDYLAQTLAVDPAEIVALHSQTALVVHALGFLPGLPFMGGCRAVWPFPVVPSRERRFRPDRWQSQTGFASSIPGSVRAGGTSVATVRFRFLTLVARLRRFWPPVILSGSIRSTLINTATWPHSCARVALTR